LFGSADRLKRSQPYGRGKSSGWIGGRSCGSTRFASRHGIASELCTMKKLPSGHTPLIAAAAGAAASSAASAAGRRGRIAMTGPPSRRPVYIRKMK
jgi:hypothetical protein